MNNNNFVVLGFKGWKGRDRGDNFDPWEPYFPEPGYYCSFLALGIEGDYEITPFPLTDNIYIKEKELMDFARLVIMYEKEEEYEEEFDRDFIDRVIDFRKDNSIIFKLHAIILYEEPEDLDKVAIKFFRNITIKDFDQIKKIRVFGDKGTDWIENINEIKKKIRSYVGEGGLKKVITIKEKD